MSEVENGLKDAASAYLRSARHQPVRWFAWGAEAFATAERENKPVLLDIGAVWCHWCHVMDRESYENAETAALLNDHFVCVKVDRDERPDVDARYQAAVQAISGQGGWPLTAFLTPDGKPFFGGTYFPPDDRYGRPSFGRVLRTMAAAFHESPEEVADSARSVMAAIEHSESFSGGLGALSEEVVTKLVGSAVRQFDGRNGGFGAQPKFPHAGALDLLLDAATRASADAEAARMAATVTLRKMAAGGIYDQLAGGFHRYSVDEKWVVPHFEKMAYDNSELLKNYTHAFASFAEPRFAAVARDIVRWMDAWLSDRTLGGFYASQDADDSLDDDGDYFTWTMGEVRAALSAEEIALAQQTFNLREVGDMHHNPLKNVLHLRDGEDGAESTEVAAMKATLYAARLQRKTPYVDKTLYTGWNAMCVSAYLDAGRTLRMPETVAFGLRSLDRALAAAWDGTALRHVIAYGKGVTPSVAVEGVLEDYAFLGTAALDAFEASGVMRYFAAAEGIAARMCRLLYDAKGAGFFDTAEDVGALGALSARRKPMQDSPTPAGNSVAAALLLRLAAYGVDGDGFEASALATLSSFAGSSNISGCMRLRMGWRRRGRYGGRCRWSLSAMMLRPMNWSWRGWRGLRRTSRWCACGT